MPSQSGCKTRRAAVLPVIAGFLRDAGYMSTDYEVPQPEPLSPVPPLTQRNLLLEAAAAAAGEGFIEGIRLVSNELTPPPGKQEHGPEQPGPASDGRGQPAS